ARSKNQDVGSRRRHGTLRSRNYSAFVYGGDYWAIRYQGQAAILKATHGLHCLSCLLRHPGRELHVCELLATPIEGEVPALVGGLRKAGGPRIPVWIQGDAGSILDSRAKVEYKRRIDDLRNDLEEAERFNDAHRAAKARSEMDSIAQQLAAAVGLGGRD